MSWRSSDPTENRTTIALLQERFRKLEKAKEMREQRERQKLLTKSQTNPAMPLDPSTVLFDSGRLPPGTSSQGSSLGHNFQTAPIMTGTSVTPFNSSSAGVRHRPRSSDDQDVDTSLHL